jgi:C-terminal processing protease CtpA/Prc
MVVGMFFCAVMPFFSDTALAPLPSECQKDPLDLLGLPNTEAYWSFDGFHPMICRVGIRITAVVPRSLAAKAGLEVDDIILAVNDLDAWPDAIPIGQEAEVVRSFMSLIGNPGPVRLKVSRSELVYEGKYAFRKIQRFEVIVDRE